MSRETIKAGDNSLNAQAGRDVIIQKYGYKLSEVKEFIENFADLFFAKRFEEAQAKYEERAIEFLEKLTLGNTENLTEIMNSLSEPEIVYSLTEAVKQYSFSGDEEKGDTLINLVANKCLEEPGTLRSIALSEAIEVVSKLTLQQINALTANWLVNNVGSTDIFTIDQLCEWLEAHLLPLVSELPRQESSYTHMAAKGVVTLVQLNKTNLGEKYLRNYPDAFSKGFELGDIEEDLRAYSDLLFDSCSNDLSKLQIKTGFGKDIDGLAARVGLSPRAEKLKEIQSRFQMSASEAIEQISIKISTFGDFADLWNSTLISNLFATPAGIALAYSRWKQLSQGSEELLIFLQND